MPRHSISSSPASAIRAGSTSARATTSVGCVADELARRHDGSFRSKFSGQLAEIRAGELQAGAAQAGDLHERVRPVGRRRGALLQGSARSRCSSSTTTSISSPGASRSGSGGGLAGHNGLRSIASTLGTQEFLRLRIGVGRPGRGDRRPVADYVLSEFEPEIDVEALIARAADAVETIVGEGVEAAQQRFN